MKIYSCLLFLIIWTNTFGQLVAPAGIYGPVPISDTMRSDFIGDWYLSGVSYYPSSGTESNDIYSSVNDVCHLRITKDSVIFFPPRERFYRSPPEGYKYESTNFHPGNGCEILVYREDRKKKSDISKYTIKYNGKELRLIETLSSNTYGEINIESCSIYKSFIDSVHLEEKLIGTWESSRLDDNQLPVADTVTLYRNSYQRNYSGGIQLFFEIKQGSLKGEITYYSSSNEKSSENRGQGIIDGVFISNFIIHLEERKLIIGSGEEKTVYDIIEITNTQMKLLLHKNQ